MCTQAIGSLTFRTSYINTVRKAITFTSFPAIFFYLNPNSKGTAPEVTRPHVGAQRMCANDPSGRTGKWSAGMCKIPCLQPEYINWRFWARFRSSLITAPRHQSLDVNIGMWLRDSFLSDSKCAIALHTHPLCTFTVAIGLQPSLCY